MKCDKIILASGSPRREELLLQMGLSFTISKANGDEVPKGETPGEIVEFLADQKAEEVANRSLGIENVLIVGADTIVVLDHKILGKPASEKEAFDMLKNLQGRVHQVYTGVSLFQTDRQMAVKMDSFHEITNVWVHKMDDWEIQKYIETGDAFDKAGAYGIQGPFGVFIDQIEGDYYNVMGLPIAALYQKMKELKIETTEKRNQDV